MARWQRTEVPNLSSKKLRNFAKIGGNGRDLDRQPSYGVQPLGATSIGTTMMVDRQNKQLPTTQTETDETAAPVHMHFKVHIPSPVFPVRNGANYMIRTPNGNNIVQD